MKHLLHYLSDRRELLLYYALTVFALLSLSALAGANMRFACYLALLMTAGLLVMLTGGFLYYRRRRILFSSLSASLPRLFDALPPPADQTERELFALIGDLSQTNAALRQQLDSAQQEQLSYYTLWVHQIKTPIAAMLLVLERTEHADAAVLKQELFRIEQYADLALRYAKLTDIASDLVITECSVLESVRETVKKYALPLIYRHLTVSLPENDLTFRSDKRWFAFLLEQILGNAAKYTKAGGVTIRLTGRALTISDTGIGIRAEDLPRLFEKGYTGFNGRLDSRASGIGLHLAKRVADALGIKITIASVQVAGTTVTLLLPEQDEFQFLS